MANSHSYPDPLLAPSPWTFHSSPTSIIHRSRSAVSLQKHLPANLHGETPSNDLRRVFSAGDLRAGETRYSPEERRERIERYRSKRRQRNFQKKITYVCRKTLADSRPRVKGRFARNGEAEAEAGREGRRSEHEEREDVGVEPDFWVSFLDNLAMNNVMA